MASLDDNAIMEKVARGDRQALRVLYERHAPFVFRVACKFLGDQEEARDITQSVFVAIMQSAHRYRAGGKLTTWIYRIVANRCLNHRAKASRRLRAPGGDRDLEELPNPEGERPDRLLDRAEQRARLQAAVGELPKRQRMALILRHEGHSYAEIAGILGCSGKAVESLLVRARRALLERCSE